MEFIVSIGYYPLDRPKGHIVKYVFLFKFFNQTFGWFSELPDSDQVKSSSLYILSYKISKEFFFVYIRSILRSFLPKFS